jgi:hypothetical protein
MSLFSLRVQYALGKPVPWWWRYTYLQPDVLRQIPDLEERFTNSLQTKDTRFIKMVNSHVNAFVENGTMPPAEIAAPILNMVEDIMAGREPTMRAGDYVALQNYMRAPQQS